ncbi:MAG: ATP-binding cassette domain-containing protein [Gammaproteobacteria bacterium]|nr:ATP-binding cassette domain-containing protein [Gammaproteobacteria bacterium]
MPQDIELFEGTVSENIARFGEIDPQQVVAAAQKAGVDELIRHLPHGYDTRLSADGKTLSAGQRQRIGLARALYRGPSLIVLDEPNSNLDDRGDLALNEALSNLHEQGATVVIVTHRMSVLKQLDKLLVLNDGQVSAFGPTQNVITNSNIFNQQRPEPQPEKISNVS